jgi:hypothetical protein
MNEHLTRDLLAARCRSKSSFGFRQKWTGFRQTVSRRLTSAQNHSRVGGGCSRREQWARAALSIAFILLFHTAMKAQTVQFLPEVDGYLKLNKMFRVYYEAKDDRDGGDSTQVTNGPSLQLYVKPLLRLKRITTFDLDDSKPRALVLEAGYRYITAPGAPNDNRFLVAATSHFPLKAGFLVTDRNRADMDWKGGTANWRYRNKLTLERTFNIRSYHPIPYVAFEPYYESQYNKWSTTTEFAGCLFPLGKHVEFNPYYEHENDTGKHPNKQQNYLGLAVYFFFSVEKKGSSKP